MKTRLLVILVLALALVLTTTAFGANVTYYVDSVAGNDANNGTSTSTAWRTLNRAETQVYGPGDQILLKRGCVWQENVFQPTGSGAAGAPIVIADYGTGNLPKIIGNTDTALKLLNVSYWTIRNLDLTQVGLSPVPLTSDLGGDLNDADATGTGFPILAIRALNNGTTAHIRVENCTIHDGHWNGIYICAGMYDVGLANYGTIDDVVVTGVTEYNVHKNGLEASCTYTKAIIYTTTNVQVLNSVFHDNGGDGAVFGPVQHGLMDHCTAYNNGWARNARVGLWCWDSSDVVIQFCESHHNRAPYYTKATRDGSGFDLDLGAIDCTIQYCYSHDNTGEGYLLMTWPIGYGFQRGKSYRQTLRYCISEHDATMNGAGIELFGGADAWMYNNVIYYIPERSAGSEMACGEGGCLVTDKWGKSGAPVARAFNNIFICDKTRSVIEGAASYLVKHMAGTLTSNNNCYYRVEGGVLFYAGSDISTWAGWQAKGYDAQGKNVNPMPQALGAGPAGYQLQAGSPCINAGTIVAGAPRGMGSQDYFGTATPVGGVYDIGIDEF